MKFTKAHYMLIIQLQLKDIRKWNPLTKILFYIPKVEEVEDSTSLILWMS